MSEWIDAAGRGYASPAVMPTPATSVSADLIVRINQLILGGLRNQVPDFDFIYVPTDSEREAAALARAVLRLRVFKVVYSQIVSRGLEDGADSVGDLIDWREPINSNFAQTLSDLISTDIRTKHWQEKMSRLMVDPPEWLIQFAVPQIILAVASTSLQITREIAVKRGPGKRWTADLPAEFDDSYTQEVLRAVTESTGRQIVSIRKCCERACRWPTWRSSSAAPVMALRVGLLIRAGAVGPRRGGPRGRPSRAGTVPAPSL
jgi:hypothetical protein